jgi:hypothetical protein
MSASGQLPARRFFSLFFEELSPGLPFAAPESLLEASPQMARPQTRRGEKSLFDGRHRSFPESSLSGSRQFSPK